MPVGAVLTAIDGVAASERLAEEVRVASGSIQQKETKAIRWMTTCQAESAVKVVVNTDRAPGRETTLTCNAKQAPPERRAEKIAELAPGVWYVDLTRASMADVQPTLVTLAKAAAIIFDVRGYPTDAGGGILPHLIDVAEQDRWMHVPVIVGPYGRIAGWQSGGWNLTPVTPYLAARRVFLTDSTAISYAESVMGYVADRRLGTIIGGTTAGTNGDVSNFTVPGGFSIRFTGVRVTRHDGQTPFHLRGVEPDIPLRPTFAGLRAGRDELLERALSLTQGQ